jgi:hypothetical protein
MLGQGFATTSGVFDPRVSVHTVDDIRSPQEPNRRAFFFGGLSSGQTGATVERRPDLGLEELRNERPHDI